MTPDGFSLDSDVEEDTRKRSRRLSSISEVMDSLREDDGSRRLSGLMGSRQPRDSILTTAGNSAVQSPDDLFDAPDTADWDNEEDHTPFLQTPLQPVSLLQLTTGPSRPTRGPRKSQGPATIKSLTDKKGKRGIEIDLAVLAKRRTALVNFTKTNPLYIPNPTTRFVFPVREFYRDYYSHIRWYIAPPPPAAQPTRRTRVFDTPALHVPTRPSPEDIYDDPSDYPEDMTVDPPSINQKSTYTDPSTNNSFLDKIARAKNPVLMSLTFDPNRIVSDFVKSLHYISEGVLKISNSETERRVDLNSVTTIHIARGPRWESFILS